MSLDRASQVRVATLGTVIEIRSEDAELDAVTELWGDTLTDREPERTIDITRETSQLELLRQVTEAAREQQAGTLLMLKAAALADPQSGDTVGLIAPAGAGKSTAARYLGRRLGYVSEDLLGIDARGRAVVHPTPLAIPQTRGREKILRTREELHINPIPRRPKLAALILLERDRQIGPPSLERVELAEALVSAAGCSVSLTALDQPLRRLTKALCLSGGPYRLRYREAQHLTDTVAEMARVRRLVFRQSWRQHRPSTPAPELGPGYYARAAYADAIESGGKVVILLDGGDRQRLVTLQGAGARIWIALSRPSNAEALQRHLQSAFADNPATLVDHAMREMIGAGLVRSG